MIKDLTFITGNANKAKYLSMWLGVDVMHHKVDLDEIQSLNSRTVVEHKARQAYSILKKPVLVEDVGLSFEAMGSLPGTLIKWFVEEIGMDGLCKMVNGLDNRAARAFITYGLFDGKDIQFFEAEQNGTISDKPRGDGGFGWNPIFIPEGSLLTYGEMDEDTFKKWNIRAHAIEKLRAYLLQDN